jgi:hypothetical protein
VDFKRFELLKYKKMSNTPKHYDNGLKHDLIDVIASYELNFNRGNVLKYVVRAGKKRQRNSRFGKGVGLFRT